MYRIEFIDKEKNLNTLRNELISYCEKNAYTAYYDFQLIIPSNSGEFFLFHNSGKHFVYSGLYILLGEISYCGNSSHAIYKSINSGELVEFIKSDDYMFPIKELL